MWIGAVHAKYCDGLPVTVVETESYLSDAKALFSPEELIEIVAAIAISPRAGDLIPRAGGVRKLLWRTRENSKRDSAWVIYYFRNSGMPIFLLAMCAKGEELEFPEAHMRTFKKVIRELLVEFSKSLYERMIS